MWPRGRIRNVCEEQAFVLVAKGTDTAKFNQYNCNTLVKNFCQGSTAQHTITHTHTHTHTHTQAQ